MDRELELGLVRRLHEGDEAAFDAVYAAYHARLFSFLARLSRRRDVAEDLVEETWLRFVARAGDLEADTRLAPYLFTIARHVHVSYCRSRLVEASYAADLPDSWAGGFPIPSPFDQAAAGEAGRRLEAALAELPVVYREVLLLVGVEALTPAEAAAVCGIRPDALRKRLSRARALLASSLETMTTPRVARAQEAI